MVFLENNSFVESKKSSEDPFGCPLPDCRDFSLPLTDSFVDFDPIREWLEEDPPIGPPPYSMDDIEVENGRFGVVDKFDATGSNQSCVKIDGDAGKVENLGGCEQESGDFGVIKKCSEMGSNQFSVKSSAVQGDAKNVQILSSLEQGQGDSGAVGKCIEMGSDEFGVKSNAAEVGSVDKKVESMDGLVQKSSGIGVVEKCIEKGGQEDVKKIESKEMESVNLGFVIEEELRRVSLSHELNDSDMVGLGGSTIRNEVVGDEVKSDMISNGVKQSAEILEEELRRVSLSRELNDSDMVGLGGSTIRNGVVGDEAKSDMISNGVKQSAEILNVDGDRGKTEEVVSDEDESESDSESESESESSGSSSSSSSSSSSDTSSDDSDDDKDEDEEEGEPQRKADIAGVETEMEEGEIMTEVDEMVAWSDDEDDVDTMKGPIRSKNEVADLPPVPAVDVSLLPHHHTLPVGTIFSVMGPQVIVEGVERHNPLSEGSILWITEMRSPLGIVDEIFGPVKNPYYIVRYNSESEVPAGVHEGTKISFVQEFADHVLNNANLYRKGYDASGENDEELSEEAEFSDDEKEAEYKRMQKMKKRGTNDGKGEDRKKDTRKSKNRFGGGKHEQSTAKQTHELSNNVSTQHFVQTPGASAATPPVFSSGVSPRHPLGQQAMIPSSSATTSSNVWMNGNPAQQTTGTGFPFNPQMQGMPWPQGNHPQPVIQPPYQNMAPFQQNIQMNPAFASNLATAAGQSNFGSGQAFAPFPGCVPPNFLNQSLFGMGMQENAMAMTNFGPNALSSSGLQQAQNFLNQSILAMAMQGQNTSTSTNTGVMAPNYLNQSVNGMGMQGQNTSTSTNVGANAVSSNGFQMTGTSNPGQDAFQNFNPGSNRGGGRMNHRGGGRFGGRRGRRPS